MGVRSENAKKLYLEGIRDGDYEAAIEKYTADPYTQHSSIVKDGKEGFKEFFGGDFLKRNPDRDIRIVRCFEDGQYVFVHALQILNKGQYRYLTADIFDTNDEGKFIEHWDMIQEVEDPTVSGHSMWDGPTEMTDLDKTEENKKLVKTFLEDVLKGGQMDRLTEFISTETYIQHSPKVGDGLEGLGAFVAKLAEEGKKMVYEEIHKVLGCGNFVVSLCKMSLGGKDTGVIDIFRIDNGKIVEHWDVMEEILPKEQWVNSGKF